MLGHPRIYEQSLFRHHTFTSCAEALGAPALCAPAAPHSPLGLIPVPEPLQGPMNTPTCGSPLVASPAGHE